MENPELEKLQYPIGKYTAPDGYSAEFIKGAIYQIATFPERLKQEVISKRGTIRYSLSKRGMDHSTSNTPLW